MKQNRKREMGIVTLGVMTMVGGLTFTNQNGAQAAVSAADTKFAKAAAKGGIGEVKLGALAAQRGSSPSIKAFGRHMVSDHSKANARLEKIAASKGIQLPKDMPAEDKPLYAKLSRLSGAAFDSAYQKAMIDDHTKDVADFNKEAQNGHDADIKNFAATTLPTLETHLSMAKTMGRRNPLRMHHSSMKK